MGTTRYSHAAQVVAIGSAWILLSASVVIINKIILSFTAFKYAIALALIHMLSASACCRLLFCVHPRMKTGLEVQFESDLQIQRDFCVIAGLFAISLIASNSALLRLDVATVQIIKAINPAMIYLLGLACRLEQYSTMLAFTLLVICGGVAYAVQGALRVQSVGLCLQILAILADSARYVYVQSKLQAHNESIDPINLLHMIAPLASVALWAGGSIWEFPSIQASTADLLKSLPLVGVSATLAFALNVSSYTYIKFTSALTMSVSGIFKDVFMVGASVLYLGSSVGLKQYIGYGLAICGTVVYALLRERLRPPDGLRDK